MKLNLGDNAQDGAVTLGGRVYVTESNRAENQRARAITAQRSDVVRGSLPVALGSFGGRSQIRGSSPVGTQRLE